MQRELRLTENKRFSLIHHDGQGRANRLLVLKTLSNDMDRSRFGIVVGKRVGGAVVRNKVKRRLREVVRSTRVNGGWDMCLIARREAASAGYYELERATEDLLKRAGLLLGLNPGSTATTASRTRLRRPPEAAAGVGPKEEVVICSESGGAEE